MYRFMIWVALRLGRPVGRALLYPISAYFVAFSRNATRGIRVYLQRVLQRPTSLLDIFRHYHCFASTLLDRIFLLNGKMELFNFNYHNHRTLLDRVDKGQGCLLLGSHLGSFEVVRGSRVTRPNAVIKILMHEDNAPLINEVLGELDPGMAQCIIPLGEPDTMIRVKECLDRGEQVGTLGDRIFKNDKSVSCKFLGHMANFPTGPILLASIVKAPVILFFGLYRGDNRYDIFFELFTEQIILDRTNREQSLQEWTQRYVDRLQYYCQIAPHNWFNFYDFWENGD